MSEEDNGYEMAVWQGKPAQARCVTVVVEPGSGHWDESLAGKLIKAVEVVLGHTGNGAEPELVYLDDEPRYVSGKHTDIAAWPGWHGWAWQLVTKRGGVGQFRQLHKVSNVQYRGVPSWL